MKLRAFALLPVVLALLAPAALAGAKADERPAPEKRVFELKKAVSDGTGAEQEEAVKQLGEITDEKLLTSQDVAGSLARVVKDQAFAPRVRVAAVEAVCKVLRYDPDSKNKALPILVARLADGADYLAVRRAVADQLGGMLKPDVPGDVTALQALEKLVRDRPNPALTAAALRALGRAGYGKAIMLVVNALREPDPDVKNAALDALDSMFKQLPVGGNLGEVVNSLIVLVSDEGAPASFRMRAASALAASIRSGTEPAAVARPLGEALAKATDAKLAQSLAETMARVPHENSVKALGQAYETFFKTPAAPGSAEVRAAVAKTLGEFFVPLARSGQQGVGQAAGELLRTILAKEQDKEGSPVALETAIYSFSNMCDPKYDRTAAVGDLIDLLLKPKGKELAPKIFKSLEYVTDQSRGDNPADWKKWYDANKGTLGAKG